jgi:putative spermidine/putrescine transport system permease protein
MQPRRIAVAVVSWLTFAYLLLPLVVVVGVSVTETAFLKFPPQGFTLKWYAGFFTDPSYMEAFWLSIKLGVVSTVIATLLGVPAALVIARVPFPGRSAVGALFLSPLILPTIVIGVAILQYAATLGFARTFWALLVGHSILVLPYVTRTTIASLINFDQSIEEAAQDLGASSFQTFFFITLPQIKAGIVAGALFAFIMSWINVEVSIFHSTPSLTTLPVKLFNYIEFSVDPFLAAVSSITILFAIVAVIVLDLTIGIEKAATSR